MGTLLAVVLSDSVTAGALRLFTAGMEPVALNKINPES